MTAACGWAGALAGGDPKPWRAEKIGFHGQLLAALRRTFPSKPEHPVEGTPPDNERRILDRTGVIILTMKETRARTRDRRHQRSADRRLQGRSGTRPAKALSTQVPVGLSRPPEPKPELILPPVRTDPTNQRLAALAKTESTPRTRALALRALPEFAQVKSIIFPTPASQPGSFYSMPNEVEAWRDGTAQSFAHSGTGDLLKPYVECRCATLSLT